VVNPLLLHSQPGPIQLHFRTAKSNLGRPPGTLGKYSAGWGSSVSYVYGEILLSPLHEVVVEDVVEPVGVGDASGRSIVSLVHVPVTA